MSSRPALCKALLEALTTVSTFEEKAKRHMQLPWAGVLCDALQLINERRYPAKQAT